MKQKISVQGAARGSRKIRHQSRVVTLGVLIAPLAIAITSGCGDTINNDYFNTFYVDSEGGEAPTAGGATQPPPAEGGAPERPAAGGAGGAGGARPSIEGGSGGDSTTAGAMSGGMGGAGLVDPGHELYPDAPYADTAVADQMLDIFGTVGTRFWFGVSEEQVDRMNNQDPGNPNPNGDIYTPGDGGTGTYVDHLWVTTPGENGTTANYGKVKVKVVGQSSRRWWTKNSIPNLNIDSNDFVKGQLIDGYEHLRLNNAQVGNIFREWLSLKLFAALEYPAPHVSYAWAGSNVWGPGIQIPMVLVERYKRNFCKRFPEWGGKCENMWEFYGDFNAYYGGGIIAPKGGGGGGPSLFDQDICQFDKCDATRAKELEALIAETPYEDGFKEALKDYIDWPAYHRFQCLSWVLATGDDALHNNNNVVLAEGADGKFRYLPYSTDISLGQDWYQRVPLPGTNTVSQGCQADKSCWADTIAECEKVVANFAALKPVEVLEEVHDTLDEAGMLRSGDEGRYSALRSWFTQRLEDLPKELEAYADNPNAVICPTGQIDCGGYCAPPGRCEQQCPFGQIDCGGYCDYPQNCQLACGKGQVDCGGYCDLPENCNQNCVPPVGPLAAAAVDVGAGGAAGVGAGGAGAGGGGPICPNIANYGIAR